MYQFSATSTSLIWLCTLPALAVAFPTHCIYLHNKILPKLRNGTFGEPEGFLLPGVLAGATMPAALFLFGMVITLHPFGGRKAPDTLSFAREDS